MGGMNRDVMKLVAGTDDATSAILPPMVPTFVVKVGAKMIASDKKCRKWEWAPFTTSARNDKHEFRHWVRAGVEYLDYPYARFDIHLDPVQYTDDEYQKYLHDDTWTKSDTDKLMDMARIFELRWAVIYDRWCGTFTEGANHRKIEDLQHRYYSVAATLSQARITKEAAAEVSALLSVPNADTSEPHLLETAAARAIATAEPQHQPFIPNTGTGTSNKMVFDLAKERERRAYLEQIWNRTKAEEEEEVALRKELKMIEQQLRKLKKSGGHILVGPQQGSQHQSRPVSPMPMPTSVEGVALLDKAFSSTAPTPMAETPYLQSGRLAPPATGGPLGINKTTLKRMETVLEELKIAKRLLVPTKRICDVYDSVRKDVLTLLTLQKVLLQKEGQLHSKRLRLATLGGSGHAMDEEALMGITPAPAPAPPPVARANKQQKPKPRTNPVVAGKVAAAPKASQKVDSGEKTLKKPAASKKRKSKAETKPTAPAATAVVPATAVTPAIAAAPSSAAAVATIVPTTPGDIPAAAPLVQVPIAKPESAEEKASAKKRARKA
ncbi:SANT/Myb-like domain of DAMP1 [Fragilaria crotonensis]|nr:SANT/Myb-like domain of DAMP1 [Fragilaria crotonensis]